MHDQIRHDDMTSETNRYGIQRVLRLLEHVLEGESQLQVSVAVAVVLMTVCEADGSCPHDLLDQVMDTAQSGALDVPHSLVADLDFVLQ